MSEPWQVLAVLVSCLLGAVALLAVGIALARTRGEERERRRRVGWWIAIVASLLVVAFAIPVVGGLVIAGLPS